MIVLVFVPFAVGAGMSLFWHDAGKWTFIGLRNFGDILASRDAPITDPLSFYFTLAVTALWTVSNVALHVIIGVTLALLLRDPLLKLRGVYRVLLIVPWAVPNYITALIWKGMFQRQFGAINGMLVALGLQPVSWFSRFWTAFAANVATNVWLGFPFMMVVTLGALTAVPADVLEAAKVDGATRWQRLRLVTLPIIKPTLAPSVTLGTIWTFNMFNVVFLVSGGEPDGTTDILVSEAYRWAFARNAQLGYAAAYAVIIFGLLALMSRVLGRIGGEAKEA
jgi:arabinogalactan oligomer/maltooligosaccharide transport system permease protein